MLLYFCQILAARSDVCRDASDTGSRGMVEIIGWFGLLSCSLREGAARAAGACCRGLVGRFGCSGCRPHRRRISSVCCYGHTALEDTTVFRCLQLLPVITELSPWDHDSEESTAPLLVPSLDSPTIANARCKAKGHASGMQADTSQTAKAS